MTTPDQVFDWACQNPAAAHALLAWVPASMFASAVAWGLARYDKLPWWARFGLHLIAGNFLQAIAAEPAPRPAIPRPAIHPAGSIETASLNAEEAARHEGQ